MTGFGDSSVNFEVSVWTKLPWSARRTESDLNQAIWWGLKEAGITIAFPQMDVHFDQPVVESLRSLAGSDSGEGARPPKTPVEVRDHSDSGLRGRSDA
jgi:small-conductance mechanosensitive channel